MDSSQMRLLVTVAATLGVVALVASVVGGAVLLRSAGLVRISPYEDLSLPSAFHSEIAHPPDRELFREALPWLPTEQEEKVLFILKWIMNQIPVVEDSYVKSSWEMVLRGRAGRGVLCSGMAQMFRDALLAHDIPARIMVLQRDLFSSDSHATVEAWVNGKWRLYDPTFHIALRADGDRVGLFEARDWFLRGKGRPISVEFLGKVSYPARIESYYIRYEALMTNIYVDLRERHFPRQVYAYPKNGLSTRSQDYYRNLYFCTLVVLPALSVFFFLCAWLLWVRQRPRRPKIEYLNTSL